jgi:hypothetical protein
MQEAEAEYKAQTQNKTARQLKATQKDFSIKVASKS